MLLAIGWVAHALPHVGQPVWGPAQAEMQTCLMPAQTNDSEPLFQKYLRRIFETTALQPSDALRIEPATSSPLTDVGSNRARLPGWLRKLHFGLGNGTGSAPKTVRARVPGPSAILSGPAADAPEVSEAETVRVRDANDFHMALHKPRQGGCSRIDTTRPDQTDPGCSILCSMPKKGARRCRSAHPPSRSTRSSSRHAMPMQHRGAG